MIIATAIAAPAPRLATPAPDEGPTTGPITPSRTGHGDEGRVPGPPPLPAGAEIAPGYQVIELLIRGNAFDIYDVWSDERFARCVAKTVRPDCPHPGRARRYLVHEGRLALGLTHPHIVRAYELLRPRLPDQPVLVLETLSGVTLGYVLEELEQRLPAEALGHLGRHLCSAVRYLHAHGHVHLDIKPGNIVSSEGRAQLIDLGLARPPGIYPRGPGTPAYMAPEQVLGGYFGPAADVWGLGLVLYYAATGHQPFLRPGRSDPQHRTATAELTDHYLQLTHEAPRLRARRRLPREVAEVIDGCLSMEPGGRPALADLDAALALLTGEDETVGPLLEA
ncbi:serine/threonine-protein kinase [Pseudonocardia sp.]|uniref:serine/threonine-protein kinase n=1 Tax=Pseudonocardia sp. TaxID=60912 RepID=UPI0026215B65|nr:serine/threonine-protein kinase [Pseudonocardia sp.]MCW2721333.1 serine/threonine protein kinase [Pseudonocardia sp.]